MSEVKMDGTLEGTVESVDSYIRTRIGQGKALNVNRITQVVTNEADTLGVEGLEEVKTLMLRTATTLRRMQKSFNHSSDFEIAFCRAASVVQELIDEKQAQADSNPTTLSFAGPSLV